MSEIAERLRGCVTGSRGIDCRDPDLLLAAADEIERQRRALEVCKDDTAMLAAEVEQLRAALVPFCKADWYALGNGSFEGIVTGAALDEAKRLNQQRTTEK